MPSLVYPNPQIIAERYILATQPFLYLPLWKKDGAAFISEDAYGHLVTVLGALWTPQGRPFDGVDDWMDISDTPFDFERTDKFALEIWFKTSSADDSSIFSKQANAVPYNGYAIDLRADGRIIFNLINSAGGAIYTQVRSTTIINNGVWHHALCQNLALNGGNASDIEIYIDGLKETTVTQSDTLGANSILNNVDLYLATRDAGGQPLNGSIGEARVYNRNLSAAEVRQNYQRTKWRYQ